MTHEETIGHGRGDRKMEHSSRTRPTSVTRIKHPSLHSRQSSKASANICSDRPTKDHGSAPQADEVNEHLKTEFQLRDARIRELEYQCEAYRSKERDISGLQAANANLEKRLDLLTQELIHAPSANQTQSPRLPDELQSPSLDLRRRSTFPKLPSLYPSVPQTPDLAYNGTERENLPAALSPRRTETEPVSPTRTRHQRVMSRPVVHRSPHSTPANSRPNSMLFSPCFKDTIWETPVKEAEGIDACNRTSRPMRKFASGSNTLKPLVLPAKSNRQSLPLSAPVESDFYAVHDSSPPHTRPSTAEARKEALQALEGRPSRSSEPPVCRAVSRLSCHTPERSSITE